MNRNILIYQHLGLGDHLICNGLVRKICESGDNFQIVTKPTGYTTIKFMFKDVENLKVVSLESGNFANPESHGEVAQYAKLNNLEVLKIGHEFMSHDTNFDKAFYKQFNVDFDNRWTNFKVVRDKEREEKLFRSLNITSDYIFVHEDKARGMEINRGIDTGLRIIRPEGLSDNLFDYLTLMERAKEIHVIESSFIFLIDSFDFWVPVFAHRYARNYPANNKPTLKLNWNILV